MEDYLSELENCNLCEWKCGVNRLEGDLGICRIGKPKVYSSMLHPAPPESYTIFMSGCNFKCLNCQNWSIAHYPASEEPIRGFVKPKALAEEALEAINSVRGEKMSVDRMFFSGGSPGPSLPYIEKVVDEAKKLGEVKVNYDTNGFLTEQSLERVLDFSTSITFDIKAYHEDVHRALTGAPVEPILRNAKYLAENAKEKLWEFRVLLIPGITDGEVQSISSFLSDIDEEIPLNFLAFRPNFVLENYRGATQRDMKKAVETARKEGLKNVGWSGRVNISGQNQSTLEPAYDRNGAKIAGGIAKEAGCVTHPRDCGNCDLRRKCPIKSHSPNRQT